MVANGRDVSADVDVACCRVPVPVTLLSIGVSDKETEQPFCVEFVS